MVLDNFSCRISIGLIVSLTLFNPFDIAKAIVLASLGEFIVRYSGCFSTKFIHSKNVNSLFGNFAAKS